MLLQQSNQLISGLTNVGSIDDVRSNVICLAFCPGRRNLSADENLKAFAVSGTMARQSLVVVDCPKSDNQVAHPLAVD